MFFKTFTAQNKSWSATEKEAYAVLNSIQRFDYSLRGMQCTLRCDHEPLEPFLSRGMKIAKLDRWGMLLQEYDIGFIHIKGKDNILSNAISRLFTIDIYKYAAEVKLQCPPASKIQPEYSEVADHVQYLKARSTRHLLNITTTTLRRLQKQDRFYKRKVHELKQVHMMNSILTTKYILKRKTIVNNLEVSIIVIPTL